MRRLPLLIGPLLLAAACVPPDCDDREPPIVGPRISTATGSLAVDDVPGSGDLVFEIGAPFGLRCGVGSHDETIAADASSLVTTVEIGCASFGVADLTLAIPDLRVLGVGRLALTTAAGDIKLALSGGSARCYAAVPERPITIVIDEARGERAPYPGNVTDDFVRRATIEFELPAGDYPGTTLDGATPPPCIASATRQVVSLSISQTADDYRHVEPVCY
ncbi:MAG: hypothetical protein H6Q90_5523 [Deltaproteobacteria bacterium]|nr:hypothetical protein [Deltaproteobacteria bacterium]